MGQGWVQGQYPSTGCQARFQGHSARCGCTAIECAPGEDPKEARCCQEEEGTIEQGQAEGRRDRIQSQASCNRTYPETSNRRKKREGKGHQVPCLEREREEADCC